MRRAAVVSQLLALALALAAFEPAAAQVRGGAFGVVNLARMTSDAPIEGVGATESDFIGSKARFGAGVVLEHGISSRLALVLEAMVVSKGARIEGTAPVDVGVPGVSAEVDGEIRSRYLEVPLQLALGPSSGGLRPYLLLGPSVGFRLGDAETRYSIRVSQSGQTLFQEQVQAKGPDQLSRVDLSLALGGGLTFPVGASRLFLEAQYVVGLTDVDPSQSATARHRGVHVRAGFTLPFGAGR